MTDQSNMTPETNLQNPTDQSAPKDGAPAPGSSDTNSSTTETTKPEAETADGDDESLLNPKPEGDDDADAGDDDNTDGDTAALFGAPEGDEAYEIALPEGVTLDAAALEAVTPLAKELNLSNEGLSKLAGVYAEAVLPGVVGQVEKQIADQVNADVAALRKGWATEARILVQGGKAEDGTDIAPDPAFGGKTLAEVQKVAAKAIDRFGGAEFREFVDQNGMGNHPVMLKWAFLTGSAISEDTNFENGNTSPATPKTREQKYYNRT